LRQHLTTHWTCCNYNFPTFSSLTSNGQSNGPKSPNL
jgi:hypothetical protein